MPQEVKKAPLTIREQYRILLVKRNHRKHMIEHSLNLMLENERRKDEKRQQGLSCIEDANATEVQQVPTTSPATAGESQQEREDHSEVGKRLLEERKKEYEARMAIRKKRVFPGAS